MREEKYLTIHGHFYQPPRENPWIEEIEIQESAAPNHDWNERISAQCYSPNGASRIVDSENRILDITNNYRYMSFNFGPTLLSWMEKHDPEAYKRIIRADIESRVLYDGHGCAIAQVYNHIILPLANKNDKYTQVLWGLRDFQKRFGRNSEGIWLAETAVDAETLEVLIDCGVKYTILSPYQAKCVNKIGEKNWQDVSWGSIDPSRAYRYYVEGTNKQKYIDLFFYDGQISKSVAFDNLLQDGNKFAHRLNDGFSKDRNRTQLVNIATDGESYGHHTKFGDMALAYTLRIGAKNLDFKITNYGQFLELYPPEYEVDIKPVSSWSCSHGVGRWKEDCGCSTGAQPHWNQKWRKPLREALDYLRDELIKLCEKEGAKYYNDFWKARNNYIDVILDRNKDSIENFLRKNSIGNLKYQDKVKALKLMEIQRFCQLMYTSCGWFFADISGIETTQILKYALRAMELASDFSKQDFEGPFLNILEEARSNIASYGSGRDIFNNYVKTAAIGYDKVVAQYAIEALYIEDDIETRTLYCYNIKDSEAKTYKNSTSKLHFGKLKIESNITLEEKELYCAVLDLPDYDFYCAVKDYDKNIDFNSAKKEIVKAFEKDDIEKTLCAIKKHFGEKSYSSKDIPIDKRKELLTKLTISKVKKAAKTYRDLFVSLNEPMSRLSALGMDLPEVFIVCAKITLLNELYLSLRDIKSWCDKEKIKKIVNIVEQTEKFNIGVNEFFITDILSKRLLELITNLKKETNTKNVEESLAFFELMNKFNAKIRIVDAQNVFYNMFCVNFENLCARLYKNEKNDLRLLLLGLMKVAAYLNINTDFYKDRVDILTGKI